MIPPALLAAADDPELRGAPLAVLVWLWGQLEPHGYRAVKTSAVGAALGIRRGTVGRALHLLVERGYLAEGPRDGAMRSYRLLVTRNRAIVPLNGHSRAS